MESIRDSLAEELVKMTGQVRFNFQISFSIFYASFVLMNIWIALVQCEKLQAEASMLPGIRVELEALRRRHSAALELMGERDEEVNIFLAWQFA